MFNKLIHIAVCIAFLAGTTTLRAAPDYSEVQRENERDLRKIQQLQDDWPAVERTNKETGKRYRAAEAALKRCIRGPWGVLFKDSITELEAARKTLEAARKQLEVARAGALSALKAQQRQLKILKEEYADVSKNGEFHRKYSVIIGDMIEDYYDVTKNVVMAGYSDYDDGFNILIEGYDGVSTECNVPLPLPTIFRQVLSIVLGQVNPVKILSRGILDRIPAKYREN